MYIDEFRSPDILKLYTGAQKCRSDFLAANCRTAKDRFIAVAAAAGRSCVRFFGLSVFCAVSFFASIPATALAGKPNIVLILTDDQDDQGSVELMPFTMKLIVEKGVRFANSFVNNPACCPSRSTLLTGMYTHNHGILGNKPSRSGGWETFVANGYEDNHLGLWMQAAGYKTALFGKYFNGYGHRGNDPSHVPPGWDGWFVMTPPKYYGFKANLNGVVKTFPSTVYSTDWLKGKVAKRIKAFAEQPEPFFLIVAPKAPHVKGHLRPAVPADRHAGTFSTLSVPDYGGAFNEADVSDKPALIQAIPPMDADSIATATAMFRGGRESLLAVDQMVWSIRNALREADVLSNTYIIFASDNGFSYGAHRHIGKGIMYQESIRVPFLIRGPGVPRGETRDGLVVNADLPATILDIAGATPGNVLDGKSLLPLIANANAAWRTSFLFQGRTAGGGRHYAVRKASSVYAEHTSRFGLEIEYYRLHADPHQLVNRAADPNFAAHETSMARLLADYLGCSGLQCQNVKETRRQSQSKPTRPSPVYRWAKPKTWPSRTAYDIVTTGEE